MRYLLFCIILIVAPASFAFQASDYSIRLRFNPSDTLADQDDIYRIIYTTSFQSSAPYAPHILPRQHACPTKQNTGPRAGANTLYHDYTDMAPRPVMLQDGNIAMFAGHFDMNVSIGKAFHTLVRDCRSVLLSQKDPNPFTFRNYEWLTSTYSVDGREIIALVNNDWKLIDVGNNREEARAKGCHGVKGANEENCWWSSLVMFRSQTGRSAPPYSAAGARWSFVPSAGGSPSLAQSSVVATTITQQTSPVDASRKKASPIAHQGGVSGYYGPTNIMKSPVDGDYYFISKARYPITHKKGYCLFRAKNGSPIASRSSWLMYGAPKGANAFATQGWTGNPCIFLPISKVMVSGVLTDVGEVRHLSYNTVLGRYVLLGVKKITGGGAQLFLIVSRGNSMVEWEQEAIPITTIPSSASARVGYFTMIDQGRSYQEELKKLPHAALSERRNFDITGEEPELLFSRYETLAGKVVKSYVVRLPMTLSKRY